MATPMFERVAVRAAQHARQDQRSAARRARLILLAASAAAAGAGAWLSGLAPASIADPDLTRLLKAMAMIKVAIVIAGITAVGWRLSWPAPAPVTTAYIAGAALTSGASILIWNLAWIPVAALVYHAGAGLMIAAAFFDRTGRGH